MWPFFGSGDGKGLHDGASAVFKWFLQHEQLDSHGVKLQNAAKVVEFFHECLSFRPKYLYFEKNEPIHKKFWHVRLSDVDWTFNSYVCDVVRSTMKVHNICVTNKNMLIQLLVKHLACFYVIYFDGQWK